MSTTERILLTTFLILVAAIALRPSIRGNDGVGYYVYISSVIRNADLDFRDDYRVFDELKQYPYKFSDIPISKITGRPMNQYGIGAALLWSPFVAVTHLGLKLWVPEKADGVSRPYEWAVGIATAFWGSLGLGLLYCRIRNDWGILPAAGTVSALIFATPLGFYLYAHGSMAHGVEFFVSTLVLLSYEKAWHKGQLGWIAACGACLGFLVMVRPQNATWPIVLGTAFLWRNFFNISPEQRLHNNFWNSSVRILLLVCTALIVFIPQMAAWNSLYGIWYSGPSVYHNGVAGFFTPLPINILNALLSERGGVLAWHPIMAVGIAGLVIYVYRDPETKFIAVLGILGFAALAWLVGSFSCWWAGASFGNRFFIGSLPWLSFGIAGWLSAPHAAARWRRSLLVIILIVWNLGLLVQYAVELVPRQDPIPWLQVIRQNLVDVPRLVWQRLL